MSVIRVLNLYCSCHQGATLGAVMSAILTHHETHVDEEECLFDLVCYLGDEALLQQLLFDAVVTAPLEAYWNALMLNDR